MENSDLMSKLQSILSTKEGQEQLKNIQSIFSSTDTSNPPPPPPPQQPPQNQGGGFDFSSLANILGSLGGSQNSSPPQSNEQPPPDNQQSQSGGGFDMSAIAQMLSGMGTNNQPSEQNSGMPNIDINMIMKLQKVFAGMNTNDKNTQLLIALKPHFSDKRRAKVDQAMSMMRLMSMLPALKESGIFSGL